MSLGPLIFTGAKSGVCFLGVFTLILLIFTLVLTCRRKNTRRLVLRIVMNSICVFALFVIALQPRWAASSVTTEAILITSGAELKIVKNFLDSTRTEIQIFTIDSTAHWPSFFRNSKAIPDLAYLVRQYSEIQTLHVFGYGLRDFDWQDIKSLKIKYHPTLPPPGINQIYWPRKVQIGQPLQIQGSLTCLSAQENWLYLSGPGGLVDSMRIGSGYEIPFKLHAVTVDTGRIMFRLKLKSGKDILFQEKFGISVIAPELLNILFLEHSPRFETKYLKNWLAKQQSSVAIRTTISHERFRFEYLNLTKKVDLNQITSNLLRRFDLLIIDGKTLNNLSANEYRALTSSVGSGGLGVLIMPDQLFLEEKSKKGAKDILYSKFRLKQISELEHHLVKVSIPSSPDSVLTAISAEPFELENQWGMQPLIKDRMGRILASAFRSGRGIVATSLIKNTYKWILNGNPQFHAAYWSYLISELVRRDNQNDQWSLGTHGPVVINHPLELRLATLASHPIGEVRTSTRGRDEIYLRQNNLYSNQWQGIFWPKRKGWHSITTNSGEPYWFYIHDGDQWQTWCQYQKQVATKNIAARNLISTKKTKFESTTRANSIPLFWFFLIFLISSAFLWVEQKV